MKLCTDYQSQLWTFEICLWQIAWDLGKLALAGQPGCLKNSVFCVLMFQNIFFWIFLDKVMIRYNFHAIVGYCQLAIVCEDVLMTFWSRSVYLYIYIYIYVSLFRYSFETVFTVDSWNMFLYFLQLNFCSPKRLSEMQIWTVERCFGFGSGDCAFVLNRSFSAACSTLIHVLAAPCWTIC